MKENECFLQIRRKTDFVPRTALVLGSGLGGYAEQIEGVCEISYSEIEGFPVSTVPGHEGKFVFGYVGQEPVVCMQGRVHYYEGYAVRDVVLPIRLMRLLGAERLVLTNAAGGIRKDLEAGDLMLITDQVSLFAPNPLVGPNEEAFGVRFPDMSRIYDPALRAVIQKAAEEESIPLKEGVYVQLTGPSFETPAEIRMLGLLGCDAAGMSTAVEAIAAVHAGMKVCGISCISNKAAGLSERPLSHEEVQEAANLAAPRFIRLLTKTLEAFAKGT